MRTAIYLGMCLSLVVMGSCRKALKNPDDYYPVVNTLEPVVTEDGTVEMSATLVSEGQSNLNFLGFCMDTVPVPEMMSNQVLVNELIDSRFSAVYNKNFDAKKTYYFRSWAANENGYAYGNIVSVTNIKAIPVVPPCTLNVNSSAVGLNGSSPGAANSVYDVTSPDNFSSTWDVKATGYSASAGRLTFKFGSELKTKIFTTTSAHPIAGQVLILVNSGFTDGVVNAGFKVYVNKLSEGVFEITVCDAPWTISGFNATGTLNARFTSPL